MTIFAMRHRGSSNFAVELLDASSGETKELLANVIGNYKGSRVVGVESGRYLLQVEADGNWTITITQPRPSTGKVPPASYTGSGPKAVGPLQLEEGLATFSMRHRGESNFAIILLDDSGEQIALLVNEIGNFQGSEAERIESSGIYWLDIGADGSWTVSVARS